MINNIDNNLPPALVEYSWIIKSCIFAFLGIIISWLWAFIHQRIKPKLAKSKRLWDEALLEAIHKPLQIFTWLIIFTMIVPIVAREYLGNMTFLTQISSMRQLLFILALIWFAMRFISGVERNAFHQAGKHKRVHDKTTVRALTQLLRIVVIIVGVLAGMQSVGLPIATLLAFGGIGGIAVGFAAKDTLANFLGGLMIFWDRPFSVGDWIRSPDRDIEGTVEDIGWRLTKIRTFDKRPLYVPNGLFSTISIENPSRMTNRRIKTLVGVRYDDARKVGNLTAAVKEMLQNHPDIDTNQTLIVNLVTFGNSSLDFMVYTFTKTTDWIEFQAIQEDVFLKILDIVDQHGAECAFPTTTMHIPDEITVQGVTQQ